MSEPTAESLDPDSFALLDRYLEQLHAGQQPDRRQFLAEHPELAAAFKCLDAMDCLALPPTASLADNDCEIHEAITLNGAEQRQVGPCSSDSPARFSALADSAGDFGDYVLLAELGRGGMGVVYKARQKSLDRLVAIKMILANHLASPDQVRRFYAEAKAAAKLDHPNIVGIHEVGQLHGQHYFVMENVEGQSLGQLLQNGPMEPAAAAECLCAIARAVEYLHSQGIVHRDLKPSNVLIDEHGQPKVTDFGLAKMLANEEHATQTGAILGTPSYMAPEQAAGQAKRVGPLSDVYSLGAILYELLTGQAPFHAGTPLDTLVQVLESEPRMPRQLNPRLPRGLEMVCLRCLEKAPEARYASAAALADDLERFLKGEIVEAQPPGIWLRLRRWSRREPALSSRLALLVPCFLIELVRIRETAYFLKIAAILAGWAAASFLFQWLLGKERWSESARFAWAAADVVLITGVLVVTGGLEGPLVVTYPAMIAAAGLWFRRRLVGFVTALSVVSYIGLMFYVVSSTPGLREPLYRHVISVVVMMVLGFVIAYQVKRIRALSRYYEHRRLP